MIIDADTDPGLVVYTYVYTVDPAGAQGHHPPTMTVAMETSPPRLEYVDSRRRAAQRDVDEGDYHEDGDGSAANMESPGSGRNIARHTGGLPSSVRIEDDTSWVAGGGCTRCDDIAPHQHSKKTELHSFHDTQTTLCCVRAATCSRIETIAARVTATMRSIKVAHTSITGPSVVCMLSPSE